MNRKIVFILAYINISLPMFSQKQIRVVREKEEGITINQVWDKIKELRQSGYKGEVEVFIPEGYYSLDRPWVVTPAHNDKSCAQITFRSEGEVVLGTGTVIKGWKNVEKNHWTVALPEVKSGKWYFRQLFAGEERLQRACIPNRGTLKTVGPLSRYEKTVSSFVWDVSQKEKNPTGYWESRCGFQYADDDFKAWDDLQEAEVLMWHSWESSWQTVLALDTLKKDVYFYSPLRYPVGSFGNQMRYRIENVRAALDMPGEWYLDRKEGILHYLARGEEQPDEMDMVAPRYDHILSFEGTATQEVAHIHFENIHFYYTDYPLGIYGTAPEWPKEIQQEIPYFPSEVKPGYTDAQAGPLCGQAIRLQYATGVSFTSCRLNHHGANAVFIGKGCSQVELEGCEMYDLGGGGAYIGFPVRDVAQAGVPYSDAPHDNKVSHCMIRNCGIIHPTAVGVWIGQSYKNVIDHNEIAYIPNSGLSIGWCWGTEKNYTSHNVMSNNYIHHAATELADASGFYSLGDCGHSVFEGNYIDEVVKNKEAFGVVYGLFMDGTSDHLEFRSNYIGRISGRDAGFAREGSPDRHIWKNNSFDPYLDRPVFENKDCPDSEEFTVSVFFDPKGAYPGLTNWHEQKWILQRNGSTDTDGFFGLQMVGQKVVAYLNIGGGRQNLYKIESENCLCDGMLNQVSLSYGHGKMKLMYGGELMGSLTINKRRIPTEGSLKIAPAGSNELREGAAEVYLVNQSLNPSAVARIGGYKNRQGTFYWKASKKAAILDKDKIKSQAGPKKEYRKLFVSIKED